MPSKNTDKLYATVDLKRLAQKLVDARLTDEARKLVVVAIASEPAGVIKQNDLSPSSTPASDKAIELLEARDLSRDSLQNLATLIREMPLGGRARNHAEIQSRRLSLNAKYLRVHADEFFYETEFAAARPPMDTDDSQSQPAEGSNKPPEKKDG